MDISSKEHKGIRVLSVQGRIDHQSAESFKVALAPYLPDCTATGKPLLLDFSGVEYISSVGLRELMIASKQVKANAGRLVIAGLQPVVNEVFQISRFYLVVKVADTVDAAVELLEEAK